MGILFDYTDYTIFVSESTPLVTTTALSTLTYMDHTGIRLPEHASNMHYYCQGGNLRGKYNSTDNVLLMPLFDNMLIFVIVRN